MSVVIPETRDSYAMLMAAAAVSLYNKDVVDKHAIPGAGIIKNLAAKYIGGVGAASAFSTLTDEDMRERYGVLGTFGRKLISPKTQAIAAGFAAAPIVGRTLRQGYIGGVKKFTGTSKGGIIRQTFRRSAFAMDPTMQAASAMQKGKGDFGAANLLKSSFMSGNYDRANKTVSATMDALKRSASDVGIKNVQFKNNILSGDNFAEIGKKMRTEAVKLKDTAGNWVNPAHKTAYDVGGKVNMSTWRRSASDVFNPYSVGGSIGAIGGGMTGMNYGPWAPASAFLDEQSSVFKPFSGRRWDPYASHSFNRHSIYR